MILYLAQGVGEAQRTRALEGGRAAGLLDDDARASVLADLLAAVAGVPVLAQLARVLGRTSATKVFRLDLI